MKKRDGKRGGNAEVIGRQEKENQSREEHQYIKGQRGGVKEKEFWGKVAGKDWRGTWEQVKRKGSKDGLKREQQGLMQYGCVLCNRNTSRCPLHGLVHLKYCIVLTDQRYAKRDSSMLRVAG